MRDHVKNDFTERTHRKTVDKSKTGSDNQLKDTRKTEQQRPVVSLLGSVTMFWYKSMGRKKRDKRQTCH
eukprot:scaffold2069_cov187-Amphora_coffeaeformis.AAC.32